MAFPPPMASSLSDPIPRQPLLLLQSLDSCQSVRDLNQIQSLVLKTRSLQNQLIFSKILSFYALSPNGDIARAQTLLAHLDSPSPSMYNSLIRGLSLHGRSPLLSYIEMLERGLSPDRFTFPSLLKALADSRALKEGEGLHGHVAKMGYASDVFVRNNLMRLYTVCGEMGYAQKLFDDFPDRDLVSWTILISGHSKLGSAEEAIRLFVEMMDGDLKADAVIMATVISACSKLGDLALGRKLHRYINVYKVNLDVFVGNALVDMYSKCGDIDSAYIFFRKMPKRNVVSWNTMISGLVQNGQFKMALALFRRMQRKGIEPNSATLVSVINTCASLGALELGEWIHSYMDRVSISADGVLGNALVDMYSKCGRIDRAMEVFVRMVKRDVYTFTAMIVGFAMHGQGDEALGLFSEMSRTSVKPNGATFVAVLSACSHAGLISIGLRHFEDMSRVYRLTPSVEHYGCVADMLGRAGLLDEALDFVGRMPIEPDISVWCALLGACKIHGKVTLGESIAKRVLELGPDEEGGYVLVSNLYASCNRGRDAKNTRKMMKKMKVKKTPGCSLIEVDGVVHEFRMGDKSHPNGREIFMVVEEIGAHLRIGSYDLSLMDVSLNSL